MSIVGDLRAALVGSLIGMLLIGCAASIPTRDVRELAGAWRGRMSGPLGNAMADLTVKEDGTYRGTMYLDAGDREFHGALVVVDRGVRFHGSDGTGTVRREEHDGRTTLHFVLDGSGTGARYTRPP